MTLRNSNCSHREPNFTPSPIGVRFHASVGEVALPCPELLTFGYMGSRQWIRSLWRRSVTRISILIPRSLIPEALNDDQRNLAFFVAELAGKLKRSNSETDGISVEARIGGSTNVDSALLAEVYGSSANNSELEKAIEAAYGSTFDKKVLAMLVRHDAEPVTYPSASAR
jgi:hypothetical protein